MSLCRWGIDSRSAFIHPPGVECPFPCPHPLVPVQQLQSPTYILKPFLLLIMTILIILLSESRLVELARVGRKSFYLGIKPSLDTWVWEFHNGYSSPPPASKCIWTAFTYTPQKNHIEFLEKRQKIKVKI